MNIKAIAGTLITVVLLSACSEEDRQEILGDIEEHFLDDKNYLHVINFPETVNAACPNWQAGETITLRESLTLPENCSYEQVTLKIDRPNVTLNCNHAVFNGITKRERNDYGVPYSEAEAPARFGIIVQGNYGEVRAENITIRNCQFVNYGDAMTVQFPLPQDILLELREGSRQESTIQAIAPTNIRVLNSKLVNSHLHGMFVNRYISHLTMSHNQILGSGNSGVYLGADVENAEISYSVIEGNGYSVYDQERRRRNGRHRSESQREGIAVDSASNNLIAHNTFRDNADGGVYLYKNCWEHVEEPYTSPHRYGSNNNVIEHNEFYVEDVGVWVAERADRDLASFTCGDPLLHSAGDRKFYRDIARNNRISNNYFESNDNGIRIQDDGTIVTDNRFVGTREGPDIKVYSGIREDVGDPVKNTTLRNNTLSKPDNISFENGAS